MQVLDLKGSIRVLCRVRPLLEKESGGAADGGPPPVKVGCLESEANVGSGLQGCEGLVGPGHAM